MRFASPSYGRSWVRVFALALALVSPVGAAFIGCASTLPAPPSKPQADSDFVTVPYPPPPARVETVPERPTSRAVWADGGWFYEANRWRWHAGGWYEAPGLFFSPWVTRRAPDGRLLFANATWRDGSGAKVVTPKVIVEAVRSNAPPDAGPEGGRRRTEFEATAISTNTPEAAAEGEETPEFAPPDAASPEEAPEAGAEAGGR